MPRNDCSCCKSGGHFYDSLGFFRVGFHAFLSKDGAMDMLFDILAAEYEMVAVMFLS